MWTRSLSSLSQQDSSAVRPLRRHVRAPLSPPMPRRSNPAYSSAPDGSRRMPSSVLLTVLQIVREYGGAAGRPAKPGSRAADSHDRGRSACRRPEPPRFRSRFPSPLQNWGCLAARAIMETNRSEYYPLGVLVGFCPAASPIRFSSALPHRRIAAGMAIMLSGIRQSSMLLVGSLASCERKGSPPPDGGRHCRDLWRACALSVRGSVWR
jgi:hypothetical protein